MNVRGSDARRALDLLPREASRGSRSSARGARLIQNVRTKVFCSALRRNKVDRRKARVCHFGQLIANIARTKRRRTKSFGTQSSFTL